MRLSLFTHDILLLLAGPVVWAVHFLAIYGFTGVVCARPVAHPGWLGIGLGSWGVGLAGLVAIAALAAWLRMRPRTEEPHNSRFVRWVSVGLGLLAVVAIVWETLSIFLVPGC